MSQNNANSAAFPCEQGTDPNGGWNQTFEQGLSKREYIAALALQGMLACSLNGDFPISEHVRFAVKAADQLLAHLEGAS